MQSLQHPQKNANRFLFGIHFCLAQRHNVSAWLDPSPFLSPIGMLVVIGFGN
jgi:hypothetical protein